MFLNREQQKKDHPQYGKYPPLASDIDVSGCFDIWNGCLLHDPTGTIGDYGPITGGCNQNQRTHSE